MSQQLKTILFRRLEGKGISRQAAPGFIRNLTNILAVYPLLSLGEVNRIMQFPGWQDVDLDYHTLQLAIADLKPHQISGLELKNPSILH
jgi:hypothetical protein